METFHGNVSCWKKIIQLPRSCNDYVNFQQIVGQSLTGIGKKPTIAGWRDDVPATLKVVTAAPGADDDDDIIIRRIDQAAAEADFVIVDLEGRATGLAGYAIAISDFVIIPVRGSNPDAKQAFRHMGLLKTQERLTGRAIPFAMLFTQTSPALRPKTQRFIEKRLADEGAPVFEMQLVDREAYRAMLSFGGTVAGLAGKGVSGLAAAVANANAFVDELLARLSNGNKPIEREEVA